jgi:hypothetical protein
MFRPVTPLQALGQGDDTGRVGWIEVNHIVRAVSRNGVEDVFDEGAGWIDDRQAVSGVKVSHDHVAHERRFADSGFTEDGHVFSASTIVDRDRAAVTLFCAEVDLHVG